MDDEGGVERGAHLVDGAEDEAHEDVEISLPGVNDPNELGDLVTAGGFLNFDFYKFLNPISYGPDGAILLADRRPLGLRSAEEGRRRRQGQFRKRASVGAV